MVRLSMNIKNTPVIRKLLLAAGLIFFLMSTHPASAQNPLHLSSVQVDLLPEYDRPSLLVIERLTLAADTSLPAQVNIKIPISAEIWAVAESDSSGALVNSIYSTQAARDENLLTITSNSLTIQVEYYAEIEKIGTTRHVVYTWAGEYDVQNFSVDFQVPAGATGLSFTPQLPNLTTVEGASHYQSGELPLAAGESYSLNVEYQKDNTDLAVTQATPAAGSANPLVQFWNDNQTTILLILLAVAVAAAAVIGLTYWQSGRKRGPVKNQRHRSAGQRGDRTGVVYCSQCGELAQPGDAFCRTCGSRLRRVP